MALKFIFIALFLALFLYSLIRPFSSMAARMFLLLGSLLGLLSVSWLDFSYLMAQQLGVATSKDLFLYLGLMTIFIFVFVTWEKFKTLDDKITKLSIEIALKNERPSD
tara:strand:- start:648 stop:971 length:324 start_codon:yes stop_codon:yes gene_type:complete